jgi:hypothetical protein
MTDDMVAGCRFHPQIMGDNGSLLHYSVLVDCGAFPHKLAIFICYAHDFALHSTDPLN